MASQDDDPPIEYTYDAAARACGDGVTPETIRQKAKRGRIRKGRPTNSGRPTVLLTLAEIEAIRSARPFRGAPDGDGRPDGQPVGQPTGQPTDSLLLVNVLEAHVQTLREELADMRRRAEKAEERTGEERAAAAEERRQAAEERERILVDAAAERRRLEDALMAAQANVATVQAALDEVRADLDRARRPWWRRLLNNS